MTDTIADGLVDQVAKDRADWLLDAVATATQNRCFLRGDPEYDEVAGEALLLNAEKAIRAAIAAMPPAGRVEEWQPIETAPKDRWILVAEEQIEAPPYDAYAARWHDDGYWMARCGQYVTQSPEPTHWRLLHEPPALSGEGR